MKKTDEVSFPRRRASEKSRAVRRLCDDFPVLAFKGKTNTGFLRPWRWIPWLVAIAAMAAGANARAVLTIEITSGVQNALPIAIVPFVCETPVSPPENVSGVITADLQRSGRFAPLPERDMLSHPRDASQIDYGDWRKLGMDHLVIGRVCPSGDGFEVRFQLFDVLRQVQLTGLTYRADRKGLRRTAHQIADVIYETLLGEPGAFATRIAYVTETVDAVGVHKYTLEVADSDGYNPRPVLVSPQPLMSPAWSPDGARLAYVSFESGTPAIYVQDVNSGARELVSHSPGLNGAPAWSPDGKRIALVLSKDGSPNIYVLDLGTKALQQITRTLAIDTEPAWAPDGKSIVFTSDRGSKPQIYRVSLATGETRRLTFEGDYNARPSISPNGKYLAVVNNSGRGFNIAVLELASGAMQVLTQGGRDESPSFAPNGSMIIYATKEGTKGFLSVVSVDGRVRQRLVLEGGQAREPAWSPYLR
jgi:TolB protein